MHTRHHQAEVLEGQGNGNKMPKSGFYSKYGEKKAKRAMEADHAGAATPVPKVESPVHKTVREKFGSRGSLPETGWPEGVDLTMPARLYVYYIFDVARKEPTVLTVEHEDRGCKLPIYLVKGVKANGCNAAKSGIPYLYPVISEPQGRFRYEASGRFPGGIVVKKQTSVGWCIAAGDFRAKTNLIVKDLHIGSLVWHPLGQAVLERIQASYLPGFAKGTDILLKLFPDSSGLIREMGEFAKERCVKVLGLPDPSGGMENVSETK